MWGICPYSYRKTSPKQNVHYFGAHDEQQKIRTSEKLASALFINC